MCNVNCGKVFDEFRIVKQMIEQRPCKLYKLRMWKVVLLTSLIFLFPFAVKPQGQVSPKGDTAIVKVSKPSGSLDKPIDYHATDSIIFNIRKNKVYLYRDASLVYGSIDLKAHYIEIDLNKKEIFATGGFDSNGRYTFLPVLRDGDDNYTADSMRYNSQSKKGRVYGLRLTQDEAVIHLSKVLKNDDGSFVGQHGKITTCNDDHPHFYFNANRIKVVPNNKVFFGSANLVVEDIPTPLAVPFGLAPLKKGRRNGILFPGYGYNQFNKSFYLQNFGYYMGLGQFADLTLSSDAYLNGDLRLGVSSNIVRRYKYRSNIALGVSWFGNGIERTSPDFKRNLDMSLRGGFGFDNKFLPGITLNGDVNIQTGNFNRLNSRDINSISNQQFQSSINFGRTFFRNKVNFTTAARHMQNTGTRDFRLELPTVNIGVSSLTPFASRKSSGQKWYEQIRLSYNMQYSNVINTKDSILFSKDYKQALKKTSTGFSHTLPISTNLKLFGGIVNMSPSFNYRENWYFKATDKYLDDTVVRTRETSGMYRLNSWDFNTGFTTNIYGTFQGLKMGRLRALRHTITPTMNIGYRPEINAALRGWQGSYTDTAGKKVNYNRFENGIFGGGVSSPENGYLGFGINNNLQGKRVTGKDSAGDEILEKMNIIDQFSISGSYNFFATKLKMSDITASLNTTLLEKINISARSGFSIYDKDSFLKGAQRYQYQVNKAPVRMRNAGFSLNTRLSPDMFKSKKATSETSKPVSGAEEEEMKDIRRQPDAYYHYDIPWNLALTYVFDYNAEIADKSQRVNNRINLSGDINLTPEWKIGYTTGYDFMQKQLVSSQFSVSRNLHCWSIDFSWIPSGFAKQWVFTLRPKSGLLQDLKLNKRAFFNPVMF